MNNDVMVLAYVQHYVDKTINAAQLIRIAAKIADVWESDQLIIIKTSTLEISVLKKASVIFTLD